MLNDAETRVQDAALRNPRLTEAALIEVITSDKARPELVQAVCAHAKWSLRREVRVALLRNENTPLAKAIQFANELPVDAVREVLQASQLPENVRSYLRELVERRKFWIE